MRKAIGMLALLALLGAAPAPAADESDNAGRVAAWVEAYNAGDDAAVAALYTEDCMRLPYQAAAVNGRDELMANIAATREAGIVSAEIVATDAESHGNTAWSQGTYKLMDADGNVVQTGKWLNVSTKVDGQWLIHRDIWNTDTPDP